MDGDAAEIRSREGGRRGTEEERAVVEREVEAMDMAGNGWVTPGLWALCVGWAIRCFEWTIDRELRIENSSSSFFNNIFQFLHFFFFNDSEHPQINSFSRGGCPKLNVSPCMRRCHGRLASPRLSASKRNAIPIQLN